MAVSRLKTIALTVVALVTTACALGDDTRSDDPVPPLPTTATSQGTSASHSGTPHVDQSPSSSLGPTSSSPLDPASPHAPSSGDGTCVTDRTKKLPNDFSPSFSVDQYREDYGDQKKETFDNGRGLIVRSKQGNRSV